MSRDGLTRLVVSLMVSGGVSTVDIRRPATAHAAVLDAVRLPGGNTLAHLFDAEVHAVPDPSVGLRVRGLTQALWRAVDRGWLEPHSQDGQALLALSDTAVRDLAAGLGQLEGQAGVAVRQAGDAWASASTCLKNCASVSVSAASM
jgi:hypothetical protein